MKTIISSVVMCHPLTISAPDFYVYNRSARQLALNWSPTVGARSQSSNGRRDCAARDTLSPHSRIVHRSPPELGGKGGG